MRLVTIPFSHYCEKARWALDHAGISYVEEGHPPLLQLRATSLRGAGRSVPVLHTKTEVLTDSSTILRFADVHAAIDRKLYPAEAEARREVCALEEDLGRVFGPAVRRFAYFHVLRDGSLCHELFQQNVVPLDAVLIRGIRPFVMAMIRRGLRITEDGAARSLSRIHETFDALDRRLAHGQGFLFGDRFTAADLTFAALASPILQPPELPSPRIPLERSPEGLRSVSEALRGTRSGAHVLAMYRRFRSRE